MDAMSGLKDRQFPTPNTVFIHGRGWRPWRKLPNVDSAITEYQSGEGKAESVQDAHIQ